LWWSFNDQRQVCTAAAAVLQEQASMNHINIQPTAAHSWWKKASACAVTM
jgi:hypothetical protein